MAATLIAINFKISAISNTKWLKIKMNLQKREVETLFAKFEWQKNLSFHVFYVTISAY